MDVPALQSKYRAQWLVYVQAVQDYSQYPSPDNQERVNASMRQLSALAASLPEPETIYPVQVTAPEDPLKWHLYTDTTHQIETETKHAEETSRIVNNSEVWTRYTSAWWWVFFGCLCLCIYVMIVYCHPA